MVGPHAPAGRTDPRRWTAIAVAAALVVGVIVTGNATRGTAAPDSATARAQAKALATEVDALETRTEVATEQYNAVASRLAGVVTESISATERLEALNGMSTQSEDAATRRVTAIYKSGSGLSLYATVLDGSSPGDMLNRLHTVQSLVNEDSSTVNDLAVAVDDAKSTKARLLTLARQRSALAKEADAARDRVDALLTQKQDALAAVNAEVTRLVAEEQARAQAAAEEQARAALAAAGGLIGDLGAAGPYASAAIESAASRLGAPYVWGATGPSTFDCSGLVQWSYAQAGLAVPRVAADQWRSGVEVPLSALAPGDLLFWATDPSVKSTIHHVAIFVGGGQMIEAPHTGAFVRQVPVRLGAEFAGAVRPGVSALAAPTA